MLRSFERKFRIHGVPWSRCDVVVVRERPFAPGGSRNGRGKMNRDLLQKTRLNFLTLPMDAPDAFERRFRLHGLLLALYDAPRGSQPTFSAVAVRTPSKYFNRSSFKKRLRKALGPLDSPVARSGRF